MALASAPLTDCAKAWLRDAVGPGLVRSLQHILEVYSKVSVSMMYPSLSLSFITENFVFFHRTSMLIL